MTSPLHRALHVGDFFRTLVDQEDDQVALGMVLGDRLRDVLQQHGLAGARRRDDQRALALADRRDDVDDAARTVLLGRVLRLHDETLVGIERGEVVERHLVAGALGVLEVDRGDAHEGEVALAIARTADLAFDRVSGAQAELPDLLGRNVDVVGARKVVGLRRAQEAEPVRQHLDNADADDLDIALGQFLEDAEQEFGLGKKGCALDLEVLGHRQKFGGGFLLEIVELHAFARFGHVIGHV